MEKIGLGCTKKKPSQFFIFLSVEAYPKPYLNLSMAFNFLTSLSHDDIFILFAKWFIL